MLPAYKRPFANRYVAKHLPIMCDVIRDLPLPKSGRISHIVHLSDVHIRTGNHVRSRYDEYSKVFERLFESLSNMPAIHEGSACIVIAGDVFHDKHRIEPPGIRLFNILLDGLTRMAPVYIIQGNHDYLQADATMPDMISAFLEASAHATTNLAYLSRTGLYRAGNVGFGLLAIQDFLLPGSGSGSRAVDDIPPFPDPSMFSEDVEFKVALFHGAYEERSGEGKKHDRAYPQECKLGDQPFDRYDVAILGDIHLMQVHGKDTASILCPLLLPPSKFLYARSYSSFCWAYSGSLIQQNFGEPLCGHGFLSWDVGNRTVSAYHVPNDVGMLTIHMGADGRWMMEPRYFFHVDRQENNGQESKPFVVENLIDDLPVRCSVRASLPRESCSSAYERDCSALMSKHGIAMSEWRVTCESSVVPCKTKVVLQGELPLLLECNQPTIWVEYVRTHADPSRVFCPGWEEWFKDTELLMLQGGLCRYSDPKAILKRNEVLLKKIQTARSMVHDLSANGSRKTMDLLRIDFSWMLCYGENCWFDFAGADGRIVALNAKNAYGKTAFLEIICYALFGKGFPSRHSGIETHGFICQQMPGGAKAVTEIRFAVDGDSYVIKRTFRFSSTKGLIQTAELKTRHASHPESVRSGVTAVKSWMDEKVGTLEKFLMGCMVTQNGDKDFFELSPKDQLDCLSNALGLNATTLLVEAIKEAKLAHASALDALTGAIAGLRRSLMDMGGDPSANEERVRELEERVSRLRAITRENAPRLSQEQALALPQERTVWILDDLIEQIRIKVEHGGPSVADLRKRADHLRGYCLCSCNCPDEAMRFSTLEEALAAEPQRPGLTETEYMDIITSYDEWSTTWPDEFTAVPRAARQDRVASCKAREVEHARRLADAEAMLESAEGRANDASQALEDLIGISVPPSEPQPWQALKPQRPLNFDPDTPPPTPDIPEAQVRTMIEADAQWRAKADAKLLHMPLFELLRMHADASDAVQGLRIKKVGLVEKQATTERDAAIARVRAKELQGIWEECVQNAAYLKTSFLLPTYVDGDLLQTLMVDLAMSGRRIFGHNSGESLDELKEAAKIEMAEHEEAARAMATREEKIDALERDAERLAERVSSTERMPFNPECSACRQQVWRMQHEKDVLAMERILQEIQDQRATDYSDTVERGAVVHDWLATFEKYGAWKLRLALKASEGALQDGRNELDEVHAALSSLSHRIRETDEHLASETERLARLDLFLEDHATWACSAYIHRAAAMWDDLNAWNFWNAKRLYDDWMHKCQRVRDENTEAQRALRELRETHAVVAALHAASVDDLDAAQSSDAMAERFERESVSLTPPFANACAERDLDIVYRRWQSRVSSVAQKELDDIEAQLKTHDDNLSCLMYLERERAERKLETSMVELGRLNAQREACARYLSSLEDAEESQRSLQLRHDTIAYIVDLMDGFKTWVFANRVKPVIETHVNRTLMWGGEHGDAVASLSMEWRKGGVAWLAKDGSNSPLVEKASGYQRFMLSLGMRITLAGLGATGLACKQLFVDEGFVACDSDNLARVPQLLRRLLSSYCYSTIILVSHLEDVRDCADVSVSIARGEHKLSHIRFGAGNAT